MGPDQACIRVRDDGVGFAEAPSASGMCSRLVDGLSRQIGGEVSVVSDGGTVVEVRFPIAQYPADCGLDSAA